ncbi:MAG: VanZ family protein [Verrucomicrobiota bacterium]
MRTAILACSFAALIGLIYLLWQHRFEAVSGSCTSSLSELRDGAPDIASGGVSWLGSAEKPVLRLEVDAAHTNLVHRIGIPDCGVVKFLHLRLKFRGEALLPGKQIWEDGRLMIEWHRLGGEGLKIEAIGSIRGDGMKEDNFVVAAAKGGAVPILRLEHLGRSGAFELQEFELREVRETVWWRYGRWILVAAWLAWTTALVSSIQKISLPRALGASAVFVTMGTLTVVPGPWKIQRSFGDAFVIKEVAQSADARVQVQSQTNGAAQIDPAKPAAKPSTIPAYAGPQQALGKIPVQGGLLLKAKYALEPFRPFLHALLIMMPTLAMAWLAGWRTALVLAVMLSIAIELSQIAFGYGFDRVDVTDLLNDALGIAAAMLVAKVYVKWGAGHRKGRAMRPAALTI